MSIRPTQVALPPPPTIGPAGYAKDQAITPAVPAQSGASSLPAVELTTATDKTGTNSAGSTGGRMAPQDPGTLGRSSTELAAAIEKAQKLASAQAQELSFSVHEKTGTVVVKVIDRESKEVIRQIPAEEMLRLAERMQELEGKNEPGLLLKQEI